MTFSMIYVYTTNIPLQNRTYVAKKNLISF